MADNQQYTLRANRALLPAMEMKDEHGDEASSSAASKHPKRAKVTAVACQPCQKRKSKCDGLRPICSSCHQKGRNDCVYDASSDLRRTSALKNKIETLQQENADLKDVLLAVCTTYTEDHSTAALELVHRHISSGDFRRIPELAEILRNPPGPIPTAHIPVPTQNNFTPTSQSFGRFQQMSPDFGGDYGAMMQGGMQAAPTVDGDPGWSGERDTEQVDSDLEPQPYQRSFMYHP